jgi:hypothetical protein
MSSSGNMLDADTWWPKNSTEFDEDVVEVHKHVGKIIENAIHMVLKGHPRVPEAKGHLAKLE